MKKVTHTQGPWHLIETTNLRNPDASAYLLANKTPYAHGILDSCNPQDAALIAAAPELLELLEAARDFILLFNPSKEHEQRPAGWVVDSLVDAFESAIAKARGES